MNIFRVFSTILYPVFVYVLLFSRWNLVESSDAWGGSSSIPGVCTKTGVVLSLKAKEATDQFDRTENNKVVTYTAKDNFGFSSVKTKTGGCSGCCGSSCCGTDVPIWDAKDEKYADSVTLYGKGKKIKFVTINIPNGNNLAYVRNGRSEPWQEYDLSKTNRVCINLHIDRDTCVYTCKIENGVKTFTARSGFVFNEVTYGLGLATQNIWKTDKKEEYANKVEFQMYRWARIYFKDGSVRAFKYRAHNEWS